MHAPPSVPAENTAAERASLFAALHDDPRADRITRKLLVPAGCSLGHCCEPLRREEIELWCRPAQGATLCASDDRLLLLSPTDATSGTEALSRTHTEGGTVERYGDGRIVHTQYGEVALVELVDAEEVQRHQRCVLTRPRRRGTATGRRDLARRCRPMTTMGR